MAVRGRKTAYCIRQRSMNCTIRRHIVVMPVAAARLRSIPAAQISLDKLVGFFVSRFKKNSLITGKRHVVIVFPGQNGGWYAIRIRVAGRSWEDDVAKVLA